MVKHGRASQLNEGELKDDHVDGGDDNNIHGGIVLCFKTSDSTSSISRHLSG